MLYLENYGIKVDNDENGESFIMDFIKNQGHETWNFFKSKLLRTSAICLVSFILIAGLFIIILQNNEDLVLGLMKKVMAMFDSKDIINNGSISFIKLLFNNLKAGAIGIGLGIIPFIFLPVFILVINAAIIGVMGAVMKLTGTGLTVFLAGILPHGIFEIPALVLGMAAGIQICKSLVKLIIRKSTFLEFKETLIGSLRVYILYMIPLFTLAAVIEVYLTPIIMNSVM